MGESMKWSATAWTRKVISDGTQEKKRRYKMTIRVDIWPQFDDLDDEGKNTGRPRNLAGWFVTECTEDRSDYSVLGDFPPEQFDEAELLARNWAEDHHGEVFWHVAWAKEPRKDARASDTVNVCDVIMHNAYNGDWYALEDEMVRQCAIRRLGVSHKSIGVVVQGEECFARISSSLSEAWNYVRLLLASGARNHAIVVDLRKGRDCPANIYRFSRNSL